MSCEPASPTSFGSSRVCSVTLPSTGVSMPAARSCFTNDPIGGKIIWALITSGWGSRDLIFETVEL